MSFVYLEKLKRSTGYKEKRDNSNYLNIIVFMQPAYIASSYVNLSLNLKTEQFK